MISGDLIIYRDKIIHLKIKLVRLELKGRRINMLFNILFDVLLLKKDKTVLGMPFL